MSRKTKNLFYNNVDKKNVTVSKKFWKKATPFPVKILSSEKTS